MPCIPAAGHERRTLQLSGRLGHSSNDFGHAYSCGALIVQSLSSCTPDRLRRLAKGADEGLPHALGISKACAPRNFLQGLDTLLYGGTRRLGAQALHGLCRRLTRLGQEGATELTRAHASHIGEPFDRQLLSKVITGELKRGANTVGRGFHVQQRGKLGLPPGTPVIDHHRSRNRARDIEA